MMKMGELGTLTAGAALRGASDSHCLCPAPPDLVGASQAPLSHPGVARSGQPEQQGRRVTASGSGREPASPPPPHSAGPGSATPPPPHVGRLALPPPLRPRPDPAPHRDKAAGLCSSPQLGKPRPPTPPRSSPPLRPPGVGAPFVLP